jgi:hypothetical protein
MGVSSAIEEIYRSLFDEAGECLLQHVIEFLNQELPYVWVDAYKQMMPRYMNIIQVQYGLFNYVFDWHTIFDPNVPTPYLPIIESRLIGVLGQSQPRKARRDDYRLKGWVGSTGQMFGNKWDKGHYVAHSIGGIVDGLEMNVYVQRRDFNRGWSAAGKRFREMERYCALNPETFCFSRPIYTDQTARPTFLEFGVLKSNHEFWVECFDNR